MGATEVEQSSDPLGLRSSGPRRLRTQPATRSVNVSCLGYSPYLRARREGGDDNAHNEPPRISWRMTGLAANILRKKVKTPLWCKGCCRPLGVAALRTTSGPLPTHDHSTRPYSLTWGGATALAHWIKRNTSARIAPILAASDMKLQTRILYYNPAPQRSARQLLSES